MFTLIEITLQFRVDYGYKCCAHLFHLDVIFDASLGSSTKITTEPSDFRPALAAAKAGPSLSPSRAPRSPLLRRVPQRVSRPSTMPGGSPSRTRRSLKTCSRENSTRLVRYNKMKLEEFMIPGEFYLQGCEPQYFKWGLN